MTSHCSVLVLGPSTVLYSETDESQSITGMLREKLVAAAPEVRWECSGRELFFHRRMTDRALRLLAEVKPDIVVYVANSRQFDEDVVVGRILRRWPRLYPSAQRLADRLKSIAGGRSLGSPTPRGWLFRLPRWLAFRTIGAEPLVSMEEATTYAKSVLDALLGVEDLGVVFGFAPGCEVVDRHSLQRIANFHAWMSDYCDARRVPHHYRYECVARAGEVPRLSPDGRHADLRTRELDASALATLVLEVQAVQAA